MLGPTGLCFHARRCGVPEAVAMSAPSRISTGVNLVCQAVSRGHAAKQDSARLQLPHTNMLDSMNRCMTWENLEVKQKTKRSLGTFHPGPRQACPWMQVPGAGWLLP